tara:strand:+ start:213 stop:479 length:267 start_codon:yes stop_codon:yes gene_type:complete
MLTKKKEIKFKINGLMNDKEIKWKSIPCICHSTDITKQYPILQSCLNCKFQHAENDLPRKSFTHLGKTINEVKIVRGKLYDDIIGIEY